jgi:hypothetical protein
MQFIAQPQRPHQTPFGVYQSAAPISNRQCSELGTLVTHTKQRLGAFLVANFGTLRPALSSHPAPPPLLLININASVKLEILLSSIKTALSKFLIDNFCHFSRRDAATLSTAASHLPGPLRLGSSLKLLEILLTCAKSATSQFLIDNFSPLLRIHFSLLSRIFTPSPCKGTLRP